MGEEEKKSKLEKRAEEEAKRLAKAEEAKLKTLDELLSEDEGPREVFVPDLNCIVKVCPLRFRDYPNLAEEKDPYKLALKTLMLTLGRADPSITEEKLGDLTLVKASRIIEALGLGALKSPLSEPRRTSPT